MAEVWETLLVIAPSKKLPDQEAAKKALEKSIAEISRKRKRRNRKHLSYPMRRVQDQNKAWLIQKSI